MPPIRVEHLKPYPELNKMRFELYAWGLLINYIPDITIEEISSLDAFYDLENRLKTSMDYALNVVSFQK